MAKQRLSIATLASAGIVMLLVLGLGTLSWTKVRALELRTHREAVVEQFVSGSLTPSAEGKLALIPSAQAACGCLDVYAGKAVNGFCVVVFIESRYKGGNFHGHMYVSAPLGSPTANASKIVHPGVAGSADVLAFPWDQVVYVGDKIDDHWHWAFCDQD